MFLQNQISRIIRELPDPDDVKNYLHLMRLNPTLRKIAQL